MIVTVPSNDFATIQMVGVDSVTVTSTSLGTTGFAVTGDISVSMTIGLNKGNLVTIDLNNQEFTGNIALTDASGADTVILTKSAVGIGKLSASSGSSKAAFSMVPIAFSLPTGATASTLLAT